MMHYYYYYYYCSVTEFTERQCEIWHVDAVEISQNRTAHVSVPTSSLCMLQLLEGRHVLVDRRGNKFRIIL